jgi:GNAT superfamily N-acetyltransferase
VAERLRPDKVEHPLFPDLVRFGRGHLGVTQIDDVWWVIRDERGSIGGGAKVAILADGHVSIDVAVDPRRQGEGLATRLYDELTRRGIDMEAGSSASLAHRSMTPDGYAFMLARRLRTDPEAEQNIARTANLCPWCGARP